MQRRNLINAKICSEMDQAWFLTGEKPPESQASASERSVDKLFRCAYIRSRDVYSAEGRLSAAEERRC